MTDFQVCLDCYEGPSSVKLFDLLAHPIERKLLKAVPVSEESFIQMHSTLGPADQLLLSLAKMEKQIWCLACQRFIPCEFIFQLFLKIETAIIGICTYFYIYYFIFSFVYQYCYGALNLLFISIQVLNFSHVAPAIVFIAVESVNEHCSSLSHLNKHTTIDEVSLYIF